MKLILVFLFTSTSAIGQLYSSYTTQGVVKGAGGPNWSVTQILLNRDKSVTISMKTFVYEQKLEKRILVDSSASRGKWTVLGEVLRLDFRPDTVYSNKKFDTYKIRKKTLIRTTLKEVGEKTKYKADGEPLQF